jgi:hypothetical protein
MTSNLALSNRYSKPVSGAQRNREFVPRAAGEFCRWALRRSRSWQFHKCIEYRTESREGSNLLGRGVWYCTLAAEHALTHAAAARAKSLTGNQLLRCRQTAWQPAQATPRGDSLSGPPSGTGGSPPGRSWKADARRWRNYPQRRGAISTATARALADARESSFSHDGQRNRAPGIAAGFSGPAKKTLCIPERRPYDDVIIKRGWQVVATPRASALRISKDRSHPCVKPIGPVARAHGRFCWSARAKFGGRRQGLAIIRSRPIISQIPRRGA